MKTDTEVQLMLRERNKGKTLAHAATKAGMSVPTARKYLHAAALPSALTTPRTYRTHPNAFASDWSWVEQQLTRDPALQSKTLFTLLLEQHPDRYTAGQLRTFQRQIAAVRAIDETEDGWEYERLVAERNQAHQELVHLATGVCRVCGAELIQPQRPKPRRAYCSHTCRQRAYRQRRATKGEPYC